MTLREELVALIRSSGIDLTGELQDDTSLIASGLLDSLALWNLVLWVEKRIGASLDPSSFDLVEEWATVGSLISFLDRRHPAARRE